MTQEYNLTIQNQLPGAITTQIAYVGARGTHNFISYTDVNMPLPINPASTTLSINARRPNQIFKRQVAGDFSRGSSSYNSLQTKLERRVGRGLDALVSYTWSKSISGPADIGGVVGAAISAPPLLTRTTPAPTAPSRSLTSPTVSWEPCFTTFPSSRALPG